MATPKPSYCCISHEFLKAATKTPNKIAVIHAAGGLRIARELRSSCESEVSDINYHKQLAELFETAASSNPPVYDGDRCFTFSEILAAVDSLSARLRNIVDGGDDPYLVRPITGSITSEQSEYAYTSWCTKSSSPATKKSSRDQHMHTPRVFGIYMLPSAEYIVTVLSVLRCGEAFAPLDPLWPKERISSLISASNIDLIIRCNSSFDGTGCSNPDKLDRLINSRNCLELYISMEKDLQQQFRSESLGWPCDAGTPREFCYLMYTSGSTGKPKGVCGTETGLLNRYSWMQEMYPLAGEELLLFKTSISFIDHLQEFLGALLTTCTLVIPSFRELKENPYHVYDFLQVYSINRLIAVPSLMRLILPALQSCHGARVQSSLKLLVLSGENFPVVLWEMLSKLLPGTTILNLYGSTEVSGDCSYFDCKRLPLILESEILNNVPIGMPISNCDLVIVGEGEDSGVKGELYVGGLCIATGYYSDISQSSTKSAEDFPYGYSFCELKNQLFFKTGDYVRRLQCGDLVYMGRKDRTIKINGQRMALEEIEGTLRRYPGVVNTAVVSHKGEGEITLLEAYLIIREKTLCGETLRSSIRAWMVDKLPSAMIPNYFYFTKSFPTTSTGKVDYTVLAGLKSHTEDHQIEIFKTGSTLLQAIKKAFCDALMVEMVSDDDDFFAIGGNSISAAHASHTLGMDMRMLYAFHSPLKLQKALLEEGLCSVSGKLGLEESKLISLDSKTLTTTSTRHEGLMGILNYKVEEYPIKRFKVESNVFSTSHGTKLANCYPWNSISSLQPRSISRCNKVFHEGAHTCSGSHQETSSIEIPSGKGGSIKELWKVHTRSCVDASPLVVFIAGEILVLIGSHSSKFLCISAESGIVCWETKLEGRIECSAVVLDNFSQVVIGCYKGNIYFLDLLHGDILWRFQTGGEVKSQPLVDKCRNLVWCGSHDHNLYALDYQNHCCVYKLHCGGSIFGSPVIDEVQNSLYVASTSGRVTAISIKEMPFSTLWLNELEAPVFGSLSINSSNGNVICCLVNGHVLAIDSAGTIAWQVKTGGPIFAGPCISIVLPSQVLVCCRDGIIYSFELESGSLLWEHNLGDPITSSAFVDENLQLLSTLSHDRLICVCTSGGSVRVLRVPSESSCGVEELNQEKKEVQEFARLDLQGDIFSSPVMIGGRIFVGCRDDYVYCLGIQT